MGAPVPDRRPWHAGEDEARRRAGVQDIPPAIRPFMIDQLRAFFSRLPLVFVAGLDAAGKPAASLLRGLPGFVSTPAPDRLDISAAFPAGDEISARPGAPLGLIGVDFMARRRNRANGRLLAAERGRLSLAVTEAFGNCPKYISARHLIETDATAGDWTPLRALDAPARALIARADTFFIASRGPDGVDMSHRGGPPGFVEFSGDGGLKIPDYRGNSYFNTFGNLLVDPAAALLFVDFPGGAALHLAGAARVSFGEDRFWTFHPERARLLRGSPFSAG
jgi:predicted pyridoxine 5'-phosphate oxidase superfamily flavin-nucleotide-binding protein